MKTWKPKIEDQKVIIAMIMQKWSKDRILKYWRNEDPKLISKEYLIELENWINEIL